MLLDCRSESKGCELNEYVDRPIRCRKSDMIGALRSESHVGNGEDIATVEDLKERTEHEHASL